MSWQPWTFTDPFIAYTPILAEEMNPKLNGISASFTYVADELNNLRPRLPSNFSGNIAIPDGTYTNTLLSIDEAGNMALVDKAEFQLAKDKDFTINKTEAQQITVGGDNHADWFIMQHVSGNGSNIEVIVGPAIADVNGTSAVAAASTIILTQDSETPLIFAPVEGVTVKSAGQLKAYGQNSTVTLVALDQYTWVLGGDVAPTDVIV